MWVVLFGQYICCMSTTSVTPLKCFTSYHSSLAPFSMLIVPQPSLTVHHHCYSIPSSSLLLHLYHHCTITTIFQLYFHHQCYTITWSYSSTITITPSLHHHRTISITVTTLSLHRPYISPTPSLIQQCTNTNTTTPFLYNEACNITASLHLNHQQYTITWLLHLHYH
jgi:hypothetical protein